MRLALLIGLLVGAAGLVPAQIGGMGGAGGLGGVGGSPFPADGNNPLDSLRGFHPWLAATGSYVTQLDNGATLPDSMMAQFAGGVGGGKAWKDSAVGLSFLVAGTYSPRSVLGGQHWREHYNGSVAYMRTVSKRVQVSGVLGGGSSYGGFGAGSSFGVSMVPGMTSTYGPGSTAGDFSGLLGTFADPGQNDLVDNEIFMRPTAYFSAMGNVSYLLSDRTYVGAFGGTGFVWRNGGLAGLGMFSGGAGVGHRISRRIELSALYSTGRYRYGSTFGGVVSQQVGGGIAARLNERTIASLQGGIGWMDSDYVGQVTLDPEAAALLGVSTELQVQHVRFSTLNAAARITRSFKNGSLSLSARRAMSPGDGLLLASVRDSAGANYGMPWGRRAGISISSYYSRNSGRVGTLGVANVAQAGGGLSYRLFAGTSLTCGAGLRSYWLPGVPRATSVYVSVGLAWTPGDRPFRF